MKRTIAICLISLVILAIPAAIIINNRANERRETAITGHLSRIEATLRELGVSDRDISHQQGCGNTQEKFGPGTKFCSRIISTEIKSSTPKQARHILESLGSTINNDSTLKIDHTSNPHLSLDDPLLTSYYYYSLNDAQYCTSEIFFKLDENSSIIETTDSALGTTQVRTSCNDESWWMRTFGS